MKRKTRNRSRQRKYYTGQEEEKLKNTSKSKASPNKASS